MLLGLVSKQFGVLIEFQPVLVAARSRSYLRLFVCRRVVLCTFFSILARFRSMSVALSIYGTTTVTPSSFIVLSLLVQSKRFQNHFRFSLEIHMVQLRLTQDYDLALLQFHLHVTIGVQMMLLYQIQHRRV